MNVFKKMYDDLTRETGIYIDPLLFPHAAMVDTIDIDHEVIDDQVYNDCLCLTAGKFDRPAHDLEGK